MGRSPEELQKLWLSSLKHERRASPNTLRAYGDDVGRFLVFQRGHLGGTVLASLAGLGEDGAAGPSQLVAQAVAGLRAVGLGDEARHLAIDAALAVGF